MKELRNSKQQLFVNLLPKMAVLHFANFFVSLVVALHAEGSSVGDFVPKSWKKSPRFNVVGIEISPARGAKNASVMVAFKDSGLPLFIFIRTSSPFADVGYATFPPAVEFSRFGSVTANRVWTCCEMVYCRRHNNEGSTAHLAYICHMPVLPSKFSEAAWRAERPGIGSGFCASANNPLAAIAALSFYCMPHVAQCSKSRIRGQVNNET